MIPVRISPFLRSARGFFLCQLIGVGCIAVTASAQAPKDGQSVLPGRVSAQSLNGLETPPQMTITPRAAIPSNAVPSNLIGNNTNGGNSPVASDLIQLYQEAAFSDPVLNTARFNYQASKERFWQGFSLLLPQVAAVPVGTRYFQHATNNSALTSYSGNSRVYDQKAYTVTLTQPVFSMAAFEAFKQGDLSTKIADMQFYAAQQDLIIRVSQAYFDALNSQDNVELYQNKKGLIKKQLEAAQAKFDTGVTTIVDVNTAQASLDLANSQEISAQADLVVKRGILEQLTGRRVGMLKPLRKEAKIDSVLKDSRSKSNDTNKTPVAESVNPPLPKGQTLEDWIKQAETANFNVLAGQLSVSLAESTYRSSQALDYPSIAFVGTSGYNTSNGSASAYTPVQTNIYNNTIALQMTIPLVSGGYNSSVIRQNAALLDAAKSTYDNYRRTAAQNTRAVFTGFYGGLASVQAFEAAERSSSSALESSQLGFQVGTLINLDVLIALDTVISTRSQLQQARYNTILNAIKLKAHAASLTDEDLISINTLLR